MTLDQIDLAVALRHYREKAQELLEAASSGFVYCQFQYGGDTFKPESTISVECIREAVKTECRRMICQWEAELQALGVTVEAEQP